MPFSKEQDVDPIGACNPSAISSALNTNCFFYDGQNHKRVLCPARSRVFLIVANMGILLDYVVLKKKQSSTSTDAFTQKQDSDQECTDDNSEIASF